MKFKIGDKVKILWEKTDYFYYNYKDEGVVCGLGSHIEVNSFYKKYPYSLFFSENQLELIEEPKEKKTFWIMANKNDVYAYFSKEDALDGLEYDDETLYEVVELKKYKKGGLIEIE